MSKSKKHIGGFNFYKCLNIFTMLVLIFNMSFLGVFFNIEDASAVSSTIQYKLEGQTKAGTFTTGNICQAGSCYSEGDNVPFKLTIGGLTSGMSYELDIQHDYQDSTGLVGYENFNTPGTWDGSASGISLSAGTVSASLPNTVTYTLFFTADSSEVELQYYGLLADNASNWSGAQLHSRLIDGVNNESVGNKDVPIQVNKLEISGCTDQEANNYSESATEDDGSCEYLGCTDDTADNYDSGANIDDGSCEYLGCTDDTADNYDSGANIDDGSCLYYGCTDDSADNYDPGANFDNGSCTYPILGCTDEEASNYNSSATEDDGSCIYPITGCTDQSAINYNPEATEDDGSCIAKIEGCTDEEADNYDPEANFDDGSCTYPVYGCTDETAANYNQGATDDDGTCEYYGCTDPLADNYDESADVEDGSCYYLGCTDPDADNYDESATEDDQSCVYSGCTDPEATNYDETATIDDDSCVYPVYGCTDPEANNYDPSATVDDQSCTYDEVCDYSIEGYKMHANDRQYLSGWDIQLWQDNELVFATTTDEEGYYFFEGLCAGDFEVHEVMQDGWRQVYPYEETKQYYYDVTLGEVEAVKISSLSDSATIIPGDAFIGLPPSFESGLDFYNEPGICGYKYNYNTDATVEGWPIYLKQIETCEEGDEWADEVYGYNLVGEIADDRKDTSQALGENDDVFVSLGFGGEIILNFENRVINGDGDDVMVYETTNGDASCDAYPEYIEAFAWDEDASDWVSLGEPDCQEGDSTFDLGDLDYTYRIKLVDASNPEDFDGGDGYDVDAVKALHCGFEEIVDETVTDENGYYCFFPEAGDYRVEEKIGGDWDYGDWNFYEYKYMDGSFDGIDPWFVNFYNIPPEDNDPICGDGEVNQDWEECDDGPNGSDYCTSDCETIGGGSDEYCGDGYVNQSWEQCDDGNQTDGDGCSSDCTTEGGGGDEPVCGDGIIEGDEACDSGANNGQEGYCSSDCSTVTTSGGGGSTGGGGGTGWRITTTEISTSEPTEETPVVLGEEGAPVLNIVKSVDINNANPGDELNYTVVVSNTGSLDAFNVVVNDVLPAGLTYDDDTTSKSWNLGDIPANESREVTFKAMIDADQAAGVITNTATAIADNYSEVSSSADVSVEEVMVLAETGFSVNELMALMMFALTSLVGARVGREKLLA